MTLLISMMTLDVTIILSKGLFYQDFFSFILERNTYIIKLKVLIKVLSSTWNGDYIINCEQTFIPFVKGKN